MSLLAEIREFCKENYNDGYDVVVEAYDDAELQEFIDQWDVDSVDKFAMAFQFIIDYRADIVAEIF